MYSNIYWITRLDSLHSLLTTGAAGSLIAFVLLVIAGIVCADVDGDGFPPGIKKWLKRIAVVGIASAVAVAFLPTTNEAILIVAGGKTYEYIQSDTSLQKMPRQATAYLSQLLQQQIEEAKTESK